MLPVRRSRRRCPTSLPCSRRRVACVDFRDHCTDDTDLFLVKLEALAEWADGVQAVAGDTTGQLAALKAAGKLKWSNGRKGNWGGRLDEFRGSCTQWQQQVDQLVRTVTEATLRSIVHWCGVRVLATAQERRADGRLEFHDLLVLARDLLRDNAEVRATLQSRYRRLLLDEFQDTDPIQIEIAVRIAGGAAATQDRWEDVDVPAGSLFVVGDPKQSIYRFRRADIGMYLRAQKVLGGQVSLTSNFRTGAPILDWVNEVFAQADRGGRREAAALPGARRRPARPDHRRCRHRARRAGACRQAVCR